jgi:alpha-N-acetylglucosamine transferase
MSLQTDLSKGFLYIAIGKRYLMEAEISARSLRRFTKFPVCIITDDRQYKNPLFDITIYEAMPGDFVAKIIGVAKTPFERTVYLDNDTFVCSCIDEMFDVLDFFDMSLMPFHFLHSYGFFDKYNPEYKLKYERIIPEYHFGVMVFKMNDAVKNLFQDWLEMHGKMNIKADCSSFREVYFSHIPFVRISPLPLEYNYHGTFSFGVAYNEIKIIHERLGERWNTLTTVMLPFHKMERKAKMINKYHYKRIIIPYFGVIPYTWSPYNIKKKIKMLFGIKRTRKAETF